mmetsp:Transcript_52007/g.58089  ORF Transcript_52007/g.58089 Transcript_52007/m.58089 type:complete len:110 (+) Transcript_52007:1550-1879(+)
MYIGFKKVPQLPQVYLLQLQAHHQRFHWYLCLHDYILGPANEMANICSRAWHLTNSQFLAYFNLHFPQKKTMASMPTVKSDEYRAHLCTFQQSIRNDVGEKYAKSKDLH